LIEDLRKERDWALELLGKAAPQDLLAEVQATDYVLLNKYRYDEAPPMATEAKCAACKYFDPLINPVFAGSYGFCHHNPPDVCAIAMPWATVGVSGWCGRFEAKDEGAEP